MPTLKALGEVEQSIAGAGQKQYKITELVRLLKCDLKDIKRRNKIVQICQYAFQETIKFESFAALLTDGKQLGDVLKAKDFRHKYMLMIEGYLRLAGFYEVVAVMGL